MDSYSTPRWLLHNTFNSGPISDYIFISFASRKPIAKVILIGPADSPYAGGLFVCSLEVNYMRKVTLHFQTPILHPNVSKEGRYEGNLSLPQRDMNLKQVLLDILQRLRQPNWTQVSSPALTEMYRSSPDAYTQAVTQHTKAWAY